MQAKRARPGFKTSIAATLATTLPGRREIVELISPIEQALSESNSACIEMMGEAEDEFGQVRLEGLSRVVESLCGVCFVLAQVEIARVCEVHFFKYLETHPKTSRKPRSIRKLRTKLRRKALRISSRTIAEPTSAEIINATANSFKHGPEDLHAATRRVLKRINVGTQFGCVQDSAAYLGAFPKITRLAALIDEWKKEVLRHCELRK